MTLTNQLKTPFTLNGWKQFLLPDDAKTLHLTDYLFFTDKVIDKTAISLFATAVFYLKHAFTFFVEAFVSFIYLFCLLNFVLIALPVSFIFGVIAGGMMLYGLMQTSFFSNLQPWLENIVHACKIMFIGPLMCLALFWAFTSASMISVIASGWIYAQDLIKKNTIQRFHSKILSLNQSASPQEAQSVISWIEANNSLINELGPKGKSALQIALECNHPECVRVLLKHGADLHANYQEDAKISLESILMIRTLECNDPVLSRIDQSLSLFDGINQGLIQVSDEITVLAKTHQITHTL